MYKRDIWTFRDSMEVEEKHTGRYGAPGQRREKKKKATSEQIKKQNQWMKVRKVRRLIKWNFTEGDYWLTFTYRPSDRPKDMEAAKKDMSNLLNRLKYHYKKQDKQLKWILKMEQGARGAIHAHAIINRIDGGDLLLAKQWKKGRVHMQLLYEEGGFQDLAEYIAKVSDTSQGEPYSRSRNMIERDPETKVMKRRTWQKDIKPPKGYYVDKTSIVEGINPVTGYPYRYYTLIKIGGGIRVYKVNIYIEADKKAPQRLERRYCFLLEYIRKDGRTETRFTLRSVRLTYNEAVLKATVEALGKLNKNCQVAIYTDNDYVKSMYETELDKWEQKDFKARTGRDIASREEWQAISAYRRQHVIRFFESDQEHTNQLREEMRACKVS